MLKIICFCLVISAVQGHTYKLKTDAEMQSALMPQELNPVFIPEKDSPLQAVLPLERLRRDTDMSDEATSLGYVKNYNRIITCIVLAVSATTEIILYLIEAYYGT